MKASTTPAKAKRSVRAAKRPSSQRQAADLVYRLTSEFGSRLQVLENSPLTKIEFGAPPELTFPNLGAVANGDIMALAFIVLMEAAKSAREDLKAIMDQVKAINDAKQAWREKLGLEKTAAAPDSDAVFQLVATLYAGHVTADVRALRQELNSRSEMGEMESLRLQMAMDRLTKLISTLSNLLKQLADTASQITQNLK